MQAVALTDSNFFIDPKPSDHLPVLLRRLASRPYRSTISPAIAKSKDYAEALAESLASAAHVFIPSIMKLASAAWFAVMRDDVETVRSILSRAPHWHLTCTAVVEQPSRLAGLVEEFVARI